MHACARVCECVAVCVSACARACVCVCVWYAMVKMLSACIIKFKFIIVLIFLASLL